MRSWAWTSAPPSPDRRANLRETEGRPDEDALAEIEALEDELAALPERDRERRARRSAESRARDVPIEWCDRETGKLQRATEWVTDGPWKPSEDEPSNATLYAISFAAWLDALITEAVAVADAPIPAPDAQSSAVEPTRALLDALMAAEAFVPAPDFDADAVAGLLATTHGDAERFHAALLEAPGSTRSSSAKTSTRSSSRPRRVDEPKDKMRKARYRKLDIGLLRE